MPESENNQEPSIATMQNEIHHIREAIDEIKKVLKSMSNDFVTQKELVLWKQLVDREYGLPKKILYGAIAIILTTVLASLLALIIIKV